MSLSDRSQKLVSNLGALTNMVRRIALEAGEITVRYHDDGGYGAVDMGVSEKGDGSLVTLADKEAEKFISDALADITPDIPMIGEEMVAGDGVDLSKVGDYFWLVDPIDGTKEFVRGGYDFTVNIALIHNQKPVLGVVFAPMHGALYAGYEGGKAIRWLEESGKEKEIRVRPEPRGGLTVLAGSGTASGAPYNSAGWAFLEQFKVNKILRHSSSLKMCFIAAGKADMYPRMGPTCLWDTAAVHAVMNAAGGFITDTKGNNLRYDPRAPKLLNPHFVASSFDWFSDLG